MTTIRIKKKSHSQRYHISDRHLGRYRHKKPRPLRAGESPLSRVHVRVRRGDGTRSSYSRIRSSSSSSSSPPPPPPAVAAAPVAAQVAAQVVSSGVRRKKRGNNWSNRRKR
jgi:hypothetical protein